MKDRVFLEWTDFKSLILDKGKIRYIIRKAYDGSEFYYMWYLGEDIECSISIEDPAGNDQDDFETNFKSYANDITVNLTSLYGVDITTNAEKAIKVADTKLEGSSSILFSHNYCDKTTWYTESSRETLETLIPNETYLIYSSSNEYWIDLTHGKIPYEDRISSSYDVKIYVDDVLQESGYTVDYEVGTVTFETSQENKTIKATYSYADGSMWKFYPTTDKIIKCIGTEIKLTDDVQFPTDIYIYFQAFINDTPLGSPTIYKNIDDIIYCADKEEKFVKFGQMSNDIIKFTFNYITSKDLKYSQGTNIRIWLSSDTALTGTKVMMKANIISLDE